MSDEGRKSARVPRRPNQEARTVDTVMEMLNGEIETLMAAESQPGWSKWALAGAIAGCLWLAIGEYEKHKIDFPTVVNWLIVVDLVGHGLMGAIGSAVKWLGRRRRPRRFLLAETWWNYTTYSKALIGFLLCQDGALIALSAYYSVGSAYPAHLVVAMVLFVITLFFVFLFGVLLKVHSFAKMPMTFPDDTDSFSGMMIGMIFSCSILYSGIGFAVCLFGRQQCWHADILRFSSAVGAILVCVFLLLRRAPTSVMLPRLVSVRRDLGIGRISAEEACRKLDIVFAGMRVSDVVETDMASLLGMNDNLESAVRTCRGCMQKLEETYLALPSEERKKDVVFQALFETLKSKDKHVRELGSEMSKRVRKLKRRVSMMRDDADSVDLADVEGIIQDEERLAKRRFDAHCAAVDRFVERATSGKPAAATIAPNGPSLPAPVDGAQT